MDIATPVNIVPVKKSEVDVIRHRYLYAAISTTCIDRANQSLALPASGGTEDLIKASLLFRPQRAAFEKLFGEPSFRLRRDCGEVVRIYVLRCQGETFLAITGPDSGTVYEWVGDREKIRVARQAIHDFFSSLGDLLMTACPDEAQRMLANIR